MEKRKKRMKKRVSVFPNFRELIFGNLFLGTHLPSRILRRIKNSSRSRSRKRERENQGADSALPFFEQVGV